jgi:hypothetical protein
LREFLRRGCVETTSVRCTICGNTSSANFSPSSPRNSARRGGAKDEPFVQVVALLPRGRFLSRDPGCGNARPPHERIWLLHAFIAKAVYQFPTTEGPAEHDASNFPARFYRAVSP